MSVNLMICCVLRSSKIASRNVLKKKYNKHDNQHNENHYGYFKEQNVA